jgi:integrase
MWPRGLSPDQVTTMHAAAFKSRLIEFGKSDATVAHRLDVMTALFDFLMQPSDATGEGLVKSNPFRPVSRSDVRPTPYARSVPVEWQTFKTILDSIPMDPRGMRDRALLLFYAFTGRRKMEVAGMRVRDLALGAKPRSYTVKTKGNKLQTFELPDICYSALKAYWVASGRLSTLRPEQGVFTRIDPNARMMGETPDCPLSPESPGVRVCCLDHFDVYLGCGRNLQEILRWHEADIEARAAILARAAARRAVRERKIRALRLAACSPR